MRYNPITFVENSDPWGHGQNDSLAFVNFGLFHWLNSGALSWDDPLLQPAANTIACLLHQYWHSVHAWEDWELGAWEDKCAEHWSSIGCVLVSLVELLRFIQSHGDLSSTVFEDTFLVQESTVQQMLDRCAHKLDELGTNEYVRSLDGDKRDVDLAQLNPLLLNVLCTKRVFRDELVLAILENIEEELLGHIGVRRYRGDVWDGRINRWNLVAGEEAQWCHGSPSMSVIYGDLFERTGRREFFERQTFHFNRTLGSLTRRWLIPEAWILDRQIRTWVPDENEPLAWAQAMLIMSLAWMKRSLANQKVPVVDSVPLLTEVFSP